MKKLSHIDSRGEASMVDVSAKAVSQREAIARGEIRLQKETVALIQRNKIAKGNVLATARIAGIQAAKKNRRTDSALSSAPDHALRSEL